MKNKVYPKGDMNVAIFNYLKGGRTMSESYQFYQEGNDQTGDSVNTTTTGGDGIPNYAVTPFIVPGPVEEGGGEQCDVMPYNDPVNHPSHYTSGKYEVIDIIEDQLGPDGIRGFCLGNAVKYICRAGKKDPTKTRQDLEKAIWYIDHYLKVSAAGEGAIE